MQFPRSLLIPRASSATLWTALLVLVLWAAPAWALKPISVSPDQDRIEITSLGEVYEARGDSLQLVMASAADAVSGRMTVRAVTPGTNPNWVAFALQNATDKPIERWLTAERYTMFGSGAIWPDLDARRLEAVTPSLGFVPERIKSDRADIFRITLEPGQTITYVAELSTERFARVYLWKPLDYELKIRDRQLFNGVLLGFTGLLAVFLTSIFAANHQVIFPAAALVAWCVLAHLTVDFGFFPKLFQLRPEDNAIYRAATESAVAASVVIFLHTFLRLSQAPSLVRMLLGLWMAGQLALVAVAVVDPRLASTFARLSFAVIAVIGALTTGALAVAGRDRALALVPMWLLFLVWVFGGAMIVTGRLGTEIAASSFISGFVLIVGLIGFTVTQFAFRAIEPVYGGSYPSQTGDQALSSVAVDGAGAGVFQWHTRRNEIKVSPLIEGMLGLQAGELSATVADFLKHVHEVDRERLRLVLWSVQEREGAVIGTQFRLRHADQSTRWFDLQAASIPGPDARETRFVGLLRDVTDSRRSHERLVHDAVHCSLTGLPNRELLVDRLRTLMARARADGDVRPAIFLIDLDRFKTLNASLGLPVGDNLLLTIARRLQRHVSGRDTLARVGGDQFAILLEADKDAADLAREAGEIRRAVRAPIKIAGQDVVITASFGIAIYDGEEAGGGDLLREAEIAMMRAKQAGADRIEVFRPDMRPELDQRTAIEADLRKALEKNQLRVLYQPVIYLPTEELAGFEAMPTFEHPTLGAINPSTMTTLAEDSDLPGKILSYVLARATQDAVRWQKELPRIDRPLFVSVNVSNRSLLRVELAREVRQVYEARVMPPGSLRLEIPESLVMDNPEQASEVLELLRATGADLALDEFGAGYTSLTYLQRFAFDTIKIDRSIIKAASGGEDAAGSTMVRSMVALAQELNRKVVADGVEDPEDVTFLRGVGCAYAQGFYYGDPMPDREAIQLLKLVRKSERRLQPRGFFRMTMKRAKNKATPEAVSGSGESTPGKIRRSQRKTVTPTPAVAVPAGSVPAGAEITDTLSPVVAMPGMPPQPTYVQPPPQVYAHAEPQHVEPQHVEPQPAAPRYDATDHHATEPNGRFEPPENPLSSLQAGLEALNGRSRATQSAPPPVPNLDAIASVFARTQPPVTSPLTRSMDDAMAALAGAVAVGTMASASPYGDVPQNGGSNGIQQPEPSARPPTDQPPPRPVRPEPLTRLRQTRPAPDLSKLPPGLAASLSKLAGAQTPVVDPPRRPIPPDPDRGT